MKQLKSLNIGYLFTMLIALAVGVLPSCKDNDDDYSPAHYTITPELKDNTINVPKEGGDKTITLDTNRPWAIETSTSWLAVDPAKGKSGKTTITIKVIENKAKDARSGNLRLSLGSLSKVIKVTQAGDPNGKDVQFEGMKLSDFLAKYDKGTDMTLEDDITLEASVISDVTGGNMGSNKNVQVQQGDKGITLRFAEPQSFAKDEVLSIKVKGAKLAYYKGTIQIDCSAGGSVTKTSKTKAIEPKLVTLEDIYNNKYKDILVAVDGVQFVKPNAKLYQPITTSQGKTLSLFFNDITDTKTQPSNDLGIVTVNISKYAKFGGEVASDKSGRIVGILSYYDNGKKKSYSIWPRIFADIQLTNDRLTEGGGGENPGGGDTPATGGTMTVKDFLDKYDTGSNTMVFNEDITLEASVISDIAGGNMGSNKNVQVQQGDKGITLRFAQPQSFAKDEVLSINVKGAKISHYKGTVQIDCSAGGTVTKTSKTKAIEPKVVTLEDIYNNKYKDILVAVDGVQFVEPNGKLYQAIKKKDGKTLSLYFNDITDIKTKPANGLQIVTVNISKYSKFGNEIASDKSGRIVGILTYYDSGKKKSYSIWPRTFADIQLTKPRLNDGGGENPGGGEEPKEKALLEIPSVEHATIKFMQDGKVVTEVDANTKVSVDLTIDEGYECTLLLANGQDILATKSFTTMEGQNKLEVRIAKKATGGDSERSVIFTETFGTPTKGKYWPSVDKYKGWVVTTNTYSDPFFDGKYSKASARLEKKANIGHIWFQAKKKSALKIEGFATNLKDLKLSYKLSGWNGGLRADALKIKTDSGYVTLSATDAEKTTGKQRASWIDISVSLPNGTTFIQFEADGLSDAVALTEVKLEAVK